MVYALVMSIGCGYIARLLRKQLPVKGSPIRGICVCAERNALESAFVLRKRASHLPPSR
jgi:hypothetical protein